MAKKKRPVSKQRSAKRGPRGARKQKGARGQRGERGPQGPTGPAGTTINGETLGRLAAELADAQDALQVQFKRIAQLQAELDQLRAEFHRAG